MKNRLSSIVFVTCAAATLFFCHGARADMAPWAAIESLMQEGQDVKIKVGSYGTALNNIDMSLERIQGDKKVLLGNGLIFSDDNMVSSEFWCNDYYSVWMGEIAADKFCETYPAVCLSCPGKEDEICVGSDCSDCTVVEDNIIYPENVPYEGNFCDSYPDYWKDCNNDGTQDCCLGCDVTYDYTYEFVDECVPPGTTQYILGGWPVEDGGSYGEEFKIDVVDAGEECDPTSTDVVEDTETETVEADTETETETETETASPPDTGTISESDEEKGSETETSTKDDTEIFESTDDTETVDTLPEDSDTAPVADTEEPSSSDSSANTDDDDSETAPSQGDTEEEPSSAKKESSGCQVSGAGALTESGVWRLMVGLF